MGGGDGIRSEVAEAAAAAAISVATSMRDRFVGGDRVEIAAEIDDDATAAAFEDRG